MCLISLHLLHFVLIFTEQNQQEIVGSQGVSGTRSGEHRRHEGAAPVRTERHWPGGPHCHWEGRRWREVKFLPFPQLRCKTHTHIVDKWRHLSLHSMFPDCARDLWNTERMLSWHIGRFRGCFRFILCDSHDVYEESIDSFDEEALERAKQREQERRAKLAQEIDFERYCTLPSWIWSSQQETSSIWGIENNKLKSNKAWGNGERSELKRQGCLCGLIERRKMSSSCHFGVLEKMSALSVSRLSLDQKEVIRARLKLLQYCDRLSTYEEILGGPHAAEGRFDHKFFEAFRTMNIVELATDYAQVNKCFYLERQTPHWITPKRKSKRFRCWNPCQFWWCLTLRCVTLLVQFIVAEMWLESTGSVVHLPRYRRAASPTLHPEQLPRNILAVWIQKSAAWSQVSYMLHREEIATHTHTRYPLLVSQEILKRGSIKLRKRQIVCWSK